MGVVCVLLLYEHSPPLYHAYIAMTIFLWTQIFSEYKFLTGLWRYLGGRKCSYFLKLITTCIFSILILELLVWLPDTLKWYSCLDVINMQAWTSLQLLYLVPTQVMSFTDRKIYTWCFITLGVTSSIYLFKLMPQRSGIPIFLWLACWLLSVFTLMPPEIPENTPLV